MMMIMKIVERDEENSELSSSVIKRNFWVMMHVIPDDKC